MRQPERGLYFLVLTNEGPSLAQAMDSLELTAPWVTFLNKPKAERAWAYYLPFTLSIMNKDHLWDFIQGKLFIFVLVELDRICQIARDKGYHAKVDWGDDLFTLRAEMPGGGAGVISYDLLKRIAMEFVSPEWIVLWALEGLKDSRGIG